MLRTLSFSSLLLFFGFFFRKALIAVNWYLLVITVKLLAEICFVVQLNTIGIHNCECVDVPHSIRGTANTPTHHQCVPPHPHAVIHWEFSQFCWVLRLGLTMRVRFALIWSRNAFEFLYIQVHTNALCWRSGSGRGIATSSGTLKTRLFFDVVHAFTSDSLEFRCCGAIFGSPHPKINCSYYGCCCCCDCCWRGINC